MRLSDLLPTVGADRASTASIDPEIRAITRDSREVGPDVVFVAVRGARVDGHDLVAGMNAAAVVVERPVRAPRGVAVIEVADTRVALARLAAALHGAPSETLPVVGITGTNGKTTIASLLAGALDAVGRPAARAGTLGTSGGGLQTPGSLTTPEAPELMAWLAAMRDRGVTAAAMEVSSIGLSQHRVDGIAFHAAVFTNLTRDHLDFHGTMEAYGAAKARLFRELLRPAGGLPRALLCGEDPAHVLMGAPADRWLYGAGSGMDVALEELRLGSEGIACTVHTPVGSAHVRSPMLGRHNALNLAAAVGAAALLGEDVASVGEALAAVAGVPGRLEVVPNAAGLVVAVDYAHTPDALAIALQASREASSGAVWVVFGCGGDRDAGKRPEMGRVAELGADRVVLTSDNPRSEDPAVILADIRRGMGAAPARVEPDREAAIAWAIGQAAPGDAVLVAGKGHETYQEGANGRLAFDDRVVCRRALGGR
jgi:UDP-N-acetylmuramoyl-L-alanyl-D-glutamate--2,6-diaminopimelate ligase